MRAGAAAHCTRGRPGPTSPSDPGLWPDPR
jgi:hypothetical protein